MVSSNAADARAEFERLRAQRALSPVLTARLAQKAVRVCLASSGEMHHGVALLCELAALPDPELARSGVEGIFRDVVEALADAFEPRFCDLYIEFFAQVLERCRRHPGAQWLDDRLQRFGLRTKEDLVRRAAGLRRPRRAALPVKKILVLSRVTLGADVAITSLLLQKAMRRCPEASLLLLASDKAALLFAGEPRVTVRRAPYPRGGSLLDRLAAWPVLTETIQQEIEGLDPGEYLILDPDSRLTQLGMLPVVHDESAYHFFESRSFSRQGLESLPELTAAWLEEVFGSDAAPLLPWVSLPPEKPRFANAVRDALGEGRWVSINLGVGDNPAKRIDDPFEARLMSALLDRGWRIFLDKGEGDAEIARADRLLASLRASGQQVAEIGENSALPTAGAQVVAWRGSLAGFGALIGVSDLYAGYDSACQHIAAALGVKTIDIFAGFRSARMPQRWRPSGPAGVHMIVADPPADPDKILAAVLEAAR